MVGALLETTEGTDRRVEQRAVAGAEPSDLRRHAWSFARAADPRNVTRLEDMTTLPGAPHDHMDALLRFLLPAARREIDEAGGFLPFGASMAVDGQVELLGPADGDDPIDVQLETLRALARERREHLVALGVCSDVTVTSGGFPEAIRVELEHRDTDPVTWLQPYRNTDEELTWGERQSLPGERRTWDG